MHLLSQISFQKVHGNYKKISSVNKDILKLYNREDLGAEYYNVIYVLIDDLIEITKGIINAYLKDETMLNLVKDLQI